MVLSKSSEAVILAHRKGYRVLPDGRVETALGKFRVLDKHFSRGLYYYRFKIGIGNGKTFPVIVHRLQAYQKFGEAALQPGVNVRHLNENSLDNSWDNIGMGSGSDNAFDRQPETRKKHSAHAGQKHSPEFIAELRAARATGASYNVLKERFGLPKSTLSYYLSTKARKTSYTHPL